MDENERILHLIEMENMTSRQFAEVVGIKASTISNIASRRNKPSLDVLQRIKSKFPHVSSEWLFLGIGEPYTEKSDSQLSIAMPECDSNMRSGVVTKQEEKSLAGSLFSAKNEESAPISTKENAAKKNITSTSHGRNIKRIIVFYDDNTYSEIIP